MTAQSREQALKVFRELISRVSHNCVYSNMSRPVQRKRRRWSGGLATTWTGTVHLHLLTFVCLFCLY